MRHAQRSLRRPRNAQLVGHRGSVEPPAWVEGAFVGVICPGSDAAYRYAERTNRARSRLASRVKGNVLPLPMRPEAPLSYRAAPPQVVADQLHCLFADPQVHLIVAAVGGFNSNGVLRHLDWDLLRRNPTHICGYSDTSALLLGIHALTDQVVLHGPALLPQWGDPHGPLEPCAASFVAAIGADTGRELEYAGFWVDPRTEWSESAALNSFHDKQRQHAPWRVVKPGIATGRLVGGNVETINMLMGTPWEPSFKDRIVFIEATGPEAHLPRFHRALTHLRDTGAFDRAHGLLIGRCPDALPFGGVTLEDVVVETLCEYHFPIVMDVDLGHTEPMLTLPVGRWATLFADSPRPIIRLYGVEQAAETDEPSTQLGSSYGVPRDE